MPQNEFIAFISVHQWIIPLVILWTIPWKGVALWRAARNRQIVWFIVLLVLNTLAILEIIYIFFFSRKRYLPNDQKPSQTKGVGKIILDIKR